MPYFYANGRRLFYREAGSGPLLLILHGNTASSACHLGELESFGGRAHAVALDLWGCGQSERCEHWPDDWWAQAGRDAAACVEALGAERAVLMGTSGGAVAALWAAILHPERVLAVLADSVVERVPPDGLRAEAAARSQRTPDQVRFWRDAHGEDWEQVVNADSRLLVRLAERGGDFFEGRLGEIRCPVLLSGSATDPLQPETGPQLLGMLRQIGEARLLLNGSGDHPLMWSRPGVFRPVAHAFLDEVWRR